MNRAQVAALTRINQAKSQFSSGCREKSPNGYRRHSLSELEKFLEKLEKEANKLAEDFELPPKDLESFSRSIRRRLHQEAGWREDYSFQAYFAKKYNW